LTTFGIDRKATIGVIGLGIMGSSFASNLLSRGYNVHVYNRTEENLDHSSKEVLLFTLLRASWLQ
jgi:3-hydroxyisobutyrate dehydrogenase-like beta-hydroxyacid dehydrogenase